MLKASEKLSTDTFLLDFLSFLQLRQVRKKNVVALHTLSLAAYVLCKYNVAQLLPSDSLLPTLELKEYVCSQYLYVPIS